MMKYVNMHEAKTHLSRIVKEVAEGEEVVISRSGKPVARLVPMEIEEKARTPGSLKGKIWISPDFDDELPDVIDGFEESRIQPE
jgi:prevent-host-death family protein